MADITDFDLHAPGQIEDALARHGAAALFEQLERASPDIVAVLRGEGPSLEDWRPGQRLLSLANQLMFAADRHGAPGLFGSPPRGGERWPGWWSGAWAVGGTDRWLVQRLLVPGDRRSFGWDAYDAGPEGCQTAIRIDVERGRLLGESVSAYSYGWTHDLTFAWREWDLRTGLVLQVFPEVQIDSRKKLTRPPGFAGFAEPVPRRADLAADELAALAASGVAPEDAQPVCRTVDTKYTLVAARRPSSPGGPLYGAGRLWVYDRDRGVAFPTAVWWDPHDFDLRIAALLDSDLVAWAVARDQNVYRVALRPGDAPAEPVRSLAVAAGSDQLACRRGDRLEIRNMRSGDLLETTALGGGPAAPASLTSPAGTFTLLRDRTSIAVHDIGSGHRIAKLLASFSLYGGSHSLHGVAVSADDRFVISSDDGGTIAVWDLWNLARDGRDSEPHWWIRGLESLGGISHLAFFWGSWRIAIATADHRLVVAPFWWQSEILAGIRTPQRVEQLVGQPYGDRVFVRSSSGRLQCLRYLPDPAPDVTACTGNTLTVRCRTPAAQSVAVAGSFNGWQIDRDRLERRDGGVFERALTLPDGRHEYKLVIDGRDWQLDPNVPFQPGPFGPNSYVDLPDEPWRGTIER